MPTSIKHILDHFDLQVEKTLKWGTAFLTDQNGVYIVSLGSDIKYLPSEPSTPQFDVEQVNLWLHNADGILLDLKRPSRQELLERLRSFWLPDESILYIGKAEKQTLSERICQFYNHKVGKKSPHTGGYWLKLLSYHKETYIHLIKTKNSKVIEEEMLQFFIGHVSEVSKSSLKDKELTLPFANLQLRSRVIKNHGLIHHYK